MPVLLAAILVLAALSTLVAVLAWQLREARRAARRLQLPLLEMTRNLDEMRLRVDALQTAVEGVVVFDANREVRFVSDTAARLLGVSVEAARGLSDIALLNDHLLHESLVRALKQPERREEPISIERGGRVLEVTISRLAGDGDWVATALLRDVTEPRRLEQVRRDFVTNVSHEFRTPLASIKAMLETLEAGGLDDRAIAVEFIGLADAEVDRLAELVEQLTELGRVDSGQAPVVVETVDPRDLAEDVVRRLAAQAKRAGVDLRAEPGPTLPPIRGDREQLGRALVNLVHNALKFTPPGGTVSVRAVARASGIELIVQDTGAGIAPAELERIFERFYKADRSRGRHGTGLGLAIVKHTVEAHGGSVSVESSIGLGSAFTVHLPVEHGGRG